MLCGFWVWENYLNWRENSFDKEILTSGAYYGIDPALIKAVIWKESRFNPNAIGSKGEIGLMQIMPATAKEWADAEKNKYFIFTDLFSPEQNIRCGTWYLRKSLLRYTNTDNPLPYALAEYNAGRGNVLKWMGGAAATNSLLFIQNITYPSTKNYVISVIERYQHYKTKWLPYVTKGSFFNTEKKAPQAFLPVT